MTNINWEENKQGGIYIKNGMSPKNDKKMRELKI